MGQQYCSQVHLAVVFRVDSVANVAQQHPHLSVPGVFSLLNMRLHRRTCSAHFNCHLQDKDNLPRGQLASCFPEGVLFITYSLLVGA